MNDKLIYAIALTGGIASGKSTTKDMLITLGHQVICADSIAHKVLDESLQEIVAHFGDGVLDSTHSAIDRKKLGSIVFANPNERKILESITHPKIHSYIMRQARILESNKKWYFLDIPLFFESGGRGCYPVRFVLTIATDNTTQMKRIIKRDNLSPQEAESRIATQLDTQIKIAQSDFVIHNTSSKQHLKSQLEQFLIWLDTQSH